MLRDVRRPAASMRPAQVSVLIVLSLMIVTGIQALRRGPGYPLSADVLAMDDPLRVGMVTRMAVRVANNGTAEVRPVFVTFSAPDAAFPIAWRRVSGPTSLAPGGTGRYVIETEASRGIGVDVQFVLRVGDPRTHTFGASAPVHASLPRPPVIVNSDFRWWTVDPETAQPTPVGWKATGVVSSLGPRLGVARSVVAGTQALVFQFADDRNARWRGVRIDQVIRGRQRVDPLFKNRLTVSAFPTSRYTPGFVPGRVGNALAMQIYVDGRLLWIVFSDQDTGWHFHGVNAILVLRSPLNRWSVHQIDLGALFEARHWAKPQDDTALFSLFAATQERSTSLEPAFGPIVSSGPLDVHVGERRPQAIWGFAGPRPPQDSCSSSFEALWGEISCVHYSPASH